MARPYDVYHEPIYTSFGLDFFVRYILDHGSYIPEHWHDAVEIIFLLEGEGLVMHSGRTLHLYKHDFAILNGRVVHSSTSVYGNITLLVQIPLSFLLRLLPPMSDMVFDVPVRSSDPDVTAHLEEAKTSLLKIGGLLQDPQKDIALQISRHMLQFIDTLYRYFAVSAQTDKHKGDQLIRLQSVLDFIKENYDRPLSVKETAAAASLQPQYFCRFFKKCTGATFLKHLSALRLSHIYNDIITTDHPIMSILDEHGFSNYKLFSRMFKNFFGTTPSGIRAQLKNGPDKAVAYAAQAQKATSSDDVRLIRP